jgi:hypothetical protein
MRRKGLTALLILVSAIALMFPVIFPNALRCKMLPDPLLCLFYKGHGSWHVMIPLSGEYQHAMVVTEGVREPVFFLRLGNGTQFRLLFYCKNQTLVTTRDTEGGAHGGFDFCSSVPFQDGAHLTVRGTLVVPSEWNPELSTPRLSFAGDMYVIEIN